MDAQMVEAILQKHPKDPSSIIQVMLDIQNELYYLPRDVLNYVSEYSERAAEQDIQPRDILQGIQPQAKGEIPHRGVHRHGVSCAGRGQDHGAD